jgi:hypothetical protein
MHFEKINRVALTSVRWREANKPPVANQVHFLLFSVERQKH